MAAAGNGDAGQGVLEQGREYQRIKRRLQGKLGRQWSAGQRLPPIKELARRLEAGQNNTQKAVAELVREGLLVSRPGLGTFVTAVVRPRHSQHGRNSARHVPMYQGAGKVVQLYVATHHPEPFVQRGVDAARAVLEEAGCRVQQMVQSPDDAELRMEVEGTSAKPAGAGGRPGTLGGMLLINFDPMEAMVWPEGVALAAATTATVLHLARARGYDVVQFDSDHAGLLAGEHLRHCGVRHVAFLGCKLIGDAMMLERTSAIRLEACIDGLGAAIPPPRWLTVPHYMSVEGAKAVGPYLKMRPRPEGIIAASDELAVGFIHGAASHGLEAGKDFQIIGFDGQEQGRKLPGGPLTTVDAPMVEMGKLAAQQLLERMGDGEREVRRTWVPGKLFKGATTGNGE